MRLFRNDLLPALEVTCANYNPVTKVSTPVDLTTATSVKVIGVRDDGTSVFSRAATSATALGVVTMNWQSGDTTTVGNIRVEVEVTWPGSKPQTFRPSELVEVVADYG